MKKIVFIILSLFAFVAYADNTITSKEYVDAQVASLQTQIPAKNANTVVTNTGTAGTIGEKKIYDTTAAYGAQSDALVTASAFNSAVQNALESEFVCVEWQGSVHDNAHCLLYEVRGATQMQALPAGYTQLEYIESTGTQWIDTEILLTSEKAKVEITASGFGGIGMYGAQDAPNTNSAILVYDNHLYVGTLEGHDFAISLFNEASAPLSTVILDANSGNIKITNYLGNTVNLTYSGSIVSHNTWTIGKMNSANGPSGGFVGKIQSVQIWDNNICVGNFISTSRDSDGELGMYDTVSNTFFTNAGTGEFIAGPVASYLPQAQGN